MSFSTFTPVFDSNSDRLCSKFALLLPIILKISSMMLLGFLITADVTILASGETNSSDPIDAGAASHDATPCRSEANIKSAWLSVLPPTSRCSMVRYRTSPIPGGNSEPLLLSWYVLRDNLFHVRAEKPFRPLLVGMRNLLVKRRLGKSAGALGLRMLGPASSPAAIPPDPDSQSADHR